MTSDRYAAQIRAVREGSDEERRAALRGLAVGAHVTEPINEVVEWALIHEDPQTRALAVAALALNARNGHSKERREQVKQMLAELGPQAIELLVEAAQDADYSVQNGAGSGLALLGQRAEPALPLLCAHIDSGCVPSVLGYLGRAGSGVSARPLVELLGASDPATRARAAKAIGHLWVFGDDTIEALIKALEDDDADVRRHATWALGYFGSRASVAVPALIAGLQAGRLQEEVLWAIQSIGHEHPSYAAPLARVYLRSENAYQRQQVCEFLAGMGPKARAATPYLLEALRDSDDGVRFRAAQALSQVGGTTLLEHAAALRKALSLIDTGLLETIGAQVREAIAALRTGWEGGFTLGEHEQRILAGLTNTLVGALQQEVTQLERELAEVRQEISLLDRLIFFSETPDEARERELEALLPGQRAALSHALQEAEATLRAELEALEGVLGADPETRAGLAEIQELGELLRACRDAPPPFLLFDESRAMMGLENCDVCAATANMGTFRVTNKTTDQSMELPYMAIHALADHGRAEYAGSFQGHGGIPLEELRAILTTQAPQDPRRLELQVLGEWLLPHSTGFEVYYGDNPFAEQKPRRLPEHVTAEAVRINSYGDTCAVCGQQRRDMSVVLRNTKTGDALALPWVAIHGLAVHGSSGYAGQYLRGDVDVERLKALLEG